MSIDIYKNAIDNVLNLVAWLRQQNSQRPCKESSLYLSKRHIALDDGLTAIAPYQLVMGPTYFTEDTRPRLLSNGAITRIVTLDSLRARKVARFLKLNRRQLARLVELVATGNEKTEEAARLRLGLAASASKWRSEYGVIHSPR